MLLSFFFFLFSFPFLGTASIREIGIAHVPQVGSLILLRQAGVITKELQRPDCILEGSIRDFGRRQFAVHTMIDGRLAMGKLSKAVL